MVKKEVEIKLIPLDLKLAKKILPPRPFRSNKETFGRILFLSGSRGMSGAALLCSKAALRVGAGISILATARSLVETIDVFNPEVITLPLTETKNGVVSVKSFKELRTLFAKVRVFVLGPGLTKSREVKILTRKCLRYFRVIKNKQKILIDADGLNGLRKFKKIRETEMLPIITPHTGELARLLHLKRKTIENNPPLYAKRAAKRYNVLVVLKGAQTIIVSPYEKIILFNYLGNAGMATAGVGDVLAGTIAGFLAQRLDSWKAAALGVFVHSLAGNIAAMQLGQDGIIASDILNYLPQAIKRIRGK